MKVTKLTLKDTIRDGGVLTNHLAGHAYDMRLQGDIVIVRSALSGRMFAVKDWKDCELVEEPVGRTETSVLSPSESVNAKRPCSPCKGLDNPKKSKTVDSTPKKKGNTKGAKT